MQNSSEARNQPGLQQKAQQQKVAKKPRRSLASRFSGFVKGIVIFGVLIVGVAAVVNQQSNLVDQRDELVLLEQQLEEARSQNDEYMRILNSDNEEEYMERIAIERLGYAYPGERRFFAINTTS